MKKYFNLLLNSVQLPKHRLNSIRLLTFLEEAMKTYFNSKHLLGSLVLSFFFLTPQIHLAQNNKALKKNAIEKAEELRPLIDEISITLWDYSETALKETRSAKFLIKKLQSAGFKIEEGVADMPTAFVATYGSGSPVIGILAEYDALPGVGNQAVPKRQPRTDGVKSGQGCGHNLFAAASVGGAIAIKNALEENGIKGTLKLFGTPAEETVVGKVYMAKAGIFEGLDAVIDWHPAD